MKRAENLTAGEKQNASLRATLQKMSVDQLSKIVTAAQHELENRATAGDDGERNASQMSDAQFQKWSTKEIMKADAQTQKRGN